MKQIISVVLTIIMIVSFTIPCYATSNQNNETADKVVYVEYLEFYDNEQYYKDLAKNDGYTVFIHVGKEYAEIEMQRLKSVAECSNRLIGNTQARGSSVPTDTWNIHTQGAYFLEDPSTAVTSVLYTNFKIYGCEAYEASIFNEYDHTSITYYMHGHSSGPNSVTVPPLTRALNYYGTGDSSQYIYASFSPPVCVSGFINCIGH